jgi:pyruvate,water dikinase
MKWLEKILHPSRHERDESRLANLRCTRFRQLVRNYGRILDAMADAAEKQGGDFILDRQYIVSLGESVIDLTESIVFDLNILAGQRFDAFYDLLDRFRVEVRRIIAANDAKMAAPPGRAEISGGGRRPDSESGLSRLARAIADSPVLYQHVGQVTCRGLAAGPVFNLATEKDPGAFPQGAVLVAPDIVPNEELIRLMRQASAILTDYGETAREAATLVREFRIPTIVGLSDASSRLETGTEVTVDADENTVYLGRVPELLEYYDAERLGPEEEPEYRLLRRLRRFLFPLTLRSTPGPPAELGDCRTVHDLVHLAHELAGEAHFEVITGLRNVKKTPVQLGAGLELPFSAIDVGGGLAESDAEAVVPGRGEIRSLPLRAFAQGVDQVLGPGARPPRQSVLPASVTATITEEHANILIQRPDGFDIVDSMIGESRESNHIYCRFASTAGGQSGETVRGAVAREILSRLEFGAAQTTRATAAWLSGVPRADMEVHVMIVGRLGAYLAVTDAAGWQAAAEGAYVDAFMAQHV